MRGVDVTAFYGLRTTAINVSQAEGMKFATQISPQLNYSLNLALGFEQEHRLLTVLEVVDRRCK